MSDDFNVTAEYDQPSYIGGETIKVTISGEDVVTETQDSQIGPLTIPIINPVTGAKTTISVPVEHATITVTTEESVIIDVSEPIVDDSPQPRTWVVSNDKLSISSVA